MIDPAEYTLYQLDRVIDDLTSLAQRPGFAQVIAQHDWPAAMRRIVDLQADAQEIANSHKVAAE